MKIIFNLKKVTALVLCAVLFLATFSVLGPTAYAEIATHTGFVNTQNDPLTVRPEPSTAKSAIGSVAKGATVEIIGEIITAENGSQWYKIIYGNGVGFVSAKYISNIQKIPEYSYDARFEQQLTDQGFPESYKVLLRQLHARHPAWKFYADHLNVTWSEAVEGENVVGNSLVQNGVSSIPDSWKSMGKDAYYWDKNSYKSYDSGNWVCAEKEVIEYYLEPRNFINENGIFIFIDQTYNPNIQTKEGLEKVLKGTFLDSYFPEDTYETYADVIMAAAENAGVNPYVLAASIIIEQGTAGTGASISGIVAGYEGYYNYYNIGAYKNGDISAVVNGMIFAKGSSSLGRPWDTRAKSIIGGAEFYANGYVNRGQDTLYYKRFNVIAKPYYENQYMTNVQGAYLEGTKLKSAYTDINSDAELCFSIPVYKNMPEENLTALPTSKGANNYYLTDLVVNGISISGFDRYINNYTTSVSSDTDKITISGAILNGASVSGVGEFWLNPGNNIFTLTVTAASGKTANYTLTVYREFPSAPAYDVSSLDITSLPDDLTYYQCEAFDRTGLTVTANYANNTSSVINDYYLTVDMNSTGKVTVKISYFGQEASFEITVNPRNSWQCVDGIWYYYGHDGEIVKGWIYSGGYWYYTTQSGAMFTGWGIIDGAWYYFSDSGIMMTGLQSIKGQSYYFNSDGAMQTGFVLIDGYNYYFASNGAMLTGWQHIGGVWYYFNEDGSMATGWKLIGDVWYFLANNGEMTTGWQYVDGVWYYMNVSGAMMTGWQIIGGTWYYFNVGGDMATGWVHDGFSWYYMDTSGAMMTGWLFIDGAWYYMNSGGNMATGWINLDETWYYLSASGAMQTGWLYDGAWYFLNPSGAMVTGWNNIGGTWYCFNESGAWIA